MPADPSAATTRRERAALAAILTIALVLRVMYLVTAWNSPGYAWQDPDGYARKALILAGPDGWQWTFRAVAYTINGQPHALPPGYSVFLSLFALFPGFPATAQIAQVLLGVIATWLVFALGRQVHSSRAGLIAAASYAIWVPNIFNVWSTSQELVYIPLILAAFVLVGRAIQREDGGVAFGIAGAVFGVAALTRSMPLFFAIPAACLHVILAGDRRRALREASALMAGFLLVTAPYSAALSRYRGQLTIIDTHGSIHVAEPGGQRTPGLADTARALTARIAAAPLDYGRASLLRARSLLHVNGGRILQIYVVAGSRSAAAVWKAFVHVGSDLLLVFSAIVAALGAVLCRDRRLSALFVLWAAVNIGIAAVGGFGGARLRAPFEPLMLVLAAVAVSGRWRRPGPIALALALAVGAIIAIGVVPQVPRSLEGRPDYGVTWPSIFNRSSGRFAGAAGLNVPAYQGFAELSATPAGGTSPRLDVRVGGVSVRTVQLTAGQPTSIRAVWPAGGLAFVELTAIRDAGHSGEQEVIHVSIAGR
jgi:4-amino-4-deoxy-L-arabinose transferase-like glycosyltransferase